jgi:hypothetical protein
MSQVNVSIILTPEFQHEAGVTGPNFVDVEDYGIEPEGVYVSTKQQDDKEAAMYFYPMHTVARVKRVVVGAE